MTLENIYYIGQTIAVVAILVSLIAVFVQMRANNNIAKVSGHRDLISQFNDWYKEMEDRSLVEIIVRGAIDFSELSPQDKLRFDAYLHRYMHICEQALYMGREKYVPEGSYNAFMFAAVAVTSNGGAVWWKDAKLTYALDFVEAVELARQQHGKVAPIWELFPSFRYAHEGLEKL